MHRATTEVKKFSKFGTMDPANRMDTNRSPTNPNPKNGTNDAPAQLQCNPAEIGRDPAPLKAGSDEPLDLRHVVGDIVRCDLITGGKPNSLMAGDVIHCFLKIFV